MRRHRGAAGRSNLGLTRFNEELVAEPFAAAPTGGRLAFGSLAPRGPLARVHWRLPPNRDDVGWNQDMAVTSPGGGLTRAPRFKAHVEVVLMSVI